MKGSFGSFRTFFCFLFLLLPLYGVSETDFQVGDPGEPHAGMDAPPPPLLESHARLATFNSPERRLLGTLPAQSQLQVVKQFWHLSLLSSFAPEAGPTELALFQQWRLEGG